MRRFIKLIVGLLIGVLLCGLVVSAGDYGKSTLKIGAGLMTEMRSIAENASNATKGTGSNGRFKNSGNIVKCNDNTGVVTFDNNLYMSMDLDNRKAYMKALLSGIKSSGSLGTKAKNQAYNFFYNQDEEVTQALKYLTEDTSADLARARKWFMPFTGGIGTIMGVFAILVFLFLGVSVLWDVAYLALPGLQLFLERGDDRRKPFGVSAEAWRVNREVANDYKNSKNEVTTYLKARVPIIMACAVCVAYLISGKVYEIMGYFANAFTNL